MTTDQPTLKLYNTLTREKEVFTPIDPDRVRMYACGPTVYNYAHVGNARAAVVFDVLYRLLRHIYGVKHVKYVRNFTDVDDKIIEASRTTGKPIDEITKHYEKIYNEDMEALGCLRPDETPRCTEHIPEMIGMISKLIAKGHAYQPPNNEHAGHVLFNVPSMKDYGKLSRKNRDELVAGARVEVAPYKKDPADFVLWKPSTPDQPGWNSPWGRGRPGWHIECSAMSEKHLGETFDIHAGGLDLIFPHHENEIAQSCCAHDGAPMANYWLHNGFLNMGDEKMSKSLGNVVYAHDLIKKWHPEVVRLALLSSHYRQPIDFTEDLLRQSKNALDSCYRTLGAYADVKAERREEYEEDILFHASAVFDDINTPTLIRRLQSSLHALDEFAEKRSDIPQLKTICEISQLKAICETQASLLGILQLPSAAYFAWKPEGVEIDEVKVQALVDARTAAKQSKNFAESDRIRDELKAMGIALEDSAEGTKWRYVGI